MPRRKKPSAADTRAAINGSLREWGVQPTKHGIHSTFSTRITSIALSSAQSNRDDAEKIDLDDYYKIPKDRDTAVGLIFVFDLLEYAEEEGFDIRSEEVADALGERLTERDDASRIIGFAPFYQDRYSLRVKRKPAFERFRETDLDPFQRFSIVREALSNAQLAYNDCSDESWMNGYAFEAIVASHAVHNEACYQCRRRNSLIWCGGSDQSWRDLFCRSCQSCFEIKSKADKAAIDRIMRYDKLQGGSFHRWCSESFKDRVEGSDFVVFVSRKPSYIKRGEWAWDVDIAEIGSVMPRLSEFSLANQCQDKRGYLKTIVTMKNRSKWFRIPVGAQPDLKSIFRESFMEVFPDEWDRVSKEAHGEATANVEEPKVEVSSVPAPSNTIDELKSSLEGLQVDDWEDYDSDECNDCTPIRSNN